MFQASKNGSLQFSLFNIKHQLQLIFLQSVCIERMQIHSYCICSQLIQVLNVSLLFTKHSYCNRIRSTFSAGMKYSSHWRSTFRLKIIPWLEFYSPDCYGDEKCVDCKAIYKELLPNYAYGVEMQTMANWSPK
jgi:hypothetical protein